MSGGVVSASAVNTGTTSGRSALSDVSDRGSAVITDEADWLSQFLPRGLAGTRIQKMATYSKFVADIGGTHARFALVDEHTDSQRASLVEVKVFKCADFSGPAETVIAYQNYLGGKLPAHACIAAAGPIDDGVVSFTNLNWRLSASELQKTLKLKKLELLNDFTAVAYSVLDLTAQDKRTLHEGEQKSDGTRVVLGAGTGLGMAALVQASGKQRIIVDSEGGHLRFAPGDHEEMTVLNHLLRDDDFVSMEMLLSGAGIVRLHRTLARINGVQVEQLQAQQITQMAHAHTDTHCVDTVRLYIKILAGFCTQLALLFKARGGIYLTGDIFRSLESALTTSAFVDQYLCAGAMTELVATTPVYLVLVDDPGLQGAAVRANRW